MFLNEVGKQISAPTEQSSQSRHKRKGKKKKNSTDNSNVLETPPPPQFQRQMPIPPHPHRPSRQLEFNQAMEDFSNMFPRLDREVIESVLRSNHGAVDVTIDQLLLLDADTDSREPSSHGNSFHSQGFPIPPFSADHPLPFGGDKPPPYSPPSPNSPFSKFNLKPNNETMAASAATPPEPERRQPSPQDIQDPFSISSYPPPLPVRKKVYKPALLGPLPDDFLRLPSAAPPRSDHIQEMVTNDLQERLNENTRKQSVLRKNDKLSQQRLEDERIALLLQNEVFLEELRRNPDFISSLDRDYLNALQEQQSVQEDNSTEGALGNSAEEALGNTEEGAIGNSTEPQGAVGGAPLGAGNVDTVDVRNKLPHMGKSTKTKLSNIAKKFNKRRRKSSKPNLPEAQPPPYNIRPLEAANLRRLDDEMKRQAEENQYASLHPISPPSQGR